MSSPYVKLGNRTLDQWKVIELKEELKRRKLTTTGLKQDLVRRLDEAVRLEMESSVDNAEDDAAPSDEPIEKANAETNVSEIAEDLKDGDINVVEKFGNSEDDCEGKMTEADPVQGTREGDQAPEPSIAECTEVEVAIEPVKPSERNEDGSSISVLIDDGQQQEDAKLELSGPSESSEAIHSKEEMETDDSKNLQPDQPLKYQVSEVDPNLGFQVTSDSVSTESVSINEKNELKIDVIDDNVKLELDFKPEMQQSPSGAVPDGESHPMDVGEPVERKDAEKPHDINLQGEINDVNNVENADSIKSIDSGDIGPPEKLSLDGDDSMEEDLMESKLMDDKSDSFSENVEKFETPSAKEEDHVDVVGHDMPIETIQHVEMKVASVESETISTVTSGKRKFLDKESVGNNDVVKKARRWNAEGLKSSEPPSGSITPKSTSEPSFKPISGSNSIASVEAPKESVVPPSSRVPTNSLRIDNFLRPFTLKAVQELLGKTGTVTNFWMDHIKTHCYVSYSSVEEAERTRNAVYNLQWPPNGGRLLVADFVDPQDVKSRAEAPPASPATPSATTPTQTTPSAAQPSPRKQALKQQIPPLPPPPLSNPPPHIRERLHPPREQPLPARDRLNLPPPPPLPEKVDPPIVTLDDLFRKTKATPRIYYLPLSDELVAAKMKTQGKNVTP